MYQGLSDRFFPAHGDVAFRSTQDDIDFEAEFAVIVDRVALGINKQDALSTSASSSCSTTGACAPSALPK